MVAGIVITTILPPILYERLIELVPTATRKISKAGNTAETDGPDAESIEYSENLDRLGHFSAENVDAALKATEILSRGVRALNFNVHGAATMTAEDGLSAARALMDCKTVPQWIELQSELVKLNAGRTAIRALLLSVMAIQVTEEALFPLIRRLNAAHCLVTKTISA